MARTLRLSLCFSNLVLGTLGLHSRMHGVAGMCADPVNPPRSM